MSHFCRRDDIAFHVEDWGGVVGWWGGGSSHNFKRNLKILSLLHILELVPFYILG